MSVTDRFSNQRMECFIIVSVTITILPSLYISPSSHFEVGFRLFFTCSVKVKDAVTYLFQQFLYLHSNIPYDLCGYEAFVLIPFLSRQQDFLFL